jgi:hypothetical protein
MKVYLLILAISFASCASMKGDVNGYSGNERIKKLSSLEGKSLQEVKAILGEPVAEGICRECGAEEVMQLVYLNKTIPRYSFALSMANKSELGCFIIDLRKRNSDDFRYQSSFMDQMGCAGEYGTINRIRKYGLN